ncbi:MAG: protoheme IX farnesyltransferase [Elusimicrobia bacterium RIFCSPHIGHO2_01_FULL_64_10]|nr:MAG: protoheme IX farnesyltransferase [Elusimicrobia bacterium RIFCSPHIGHO2_01_FULL_64_10]
MPAEMGVRGRTRAADCIALTKPGITAVVAMTSLFGFLLGARFAGRGLDWSLLLHTLLGTALASAGAGTLNMVLEVAEDSLMDRTKDRPLPRGRLRPEGAFLAGILLSSAGVAHLAGSVGILPAFAAGMSLMLYLAVYTPMKKTSPACALVGAASGALPPLIGWTAARGSVGPEGWSLFLVLFVWQFPHLLALWWMHRGDYARAGFKMMPVPDVEGRLTSRLAFGSTIVLLGASLVPFHLGLSGGWYVPSALLLGTAFSGFAFRFLSRRDRAAARNVFLASVIYIPALLAAMVMGGAA